MYTTAGYQKLQDCVQDYQRQGWERTPESAGKWRDGRHAASSPSHR